MKEHRNGREAELERWVDFRDLKRAGIVDSWQTLLSWQRDPQISFPLGRVFGRKARRWALHGEIEPWLASRPTARPMEEEETRR